MTINRNRNKYTQRNWQFFGIKYAYSDMDQKEVFMYGVHMQKDFSKTLYVKIKRTARFHRGEKLVYVRETIAQNGRHSIDVLAPTPGWLPHIKKFELYEVEFLFPEDKHKINDLRELGELLKR